MISVYIDVAANAKHRASMHHSLAAHLTERFPNQPDMARLLTALQAFEGAIPEPDLKNKEYKKEVQRQNAWTMYVDAVRLTRDLALAATTARFPDVLSDKLHPDILQEIGLLSRSLEITTKVVKGEGLSKAESDELNGLAGQAESMVLRLGGESDRQKLWAALFLTMSVLLAIVVPVAAILVAYALSVSLSQSVVSAHRKSSLFHHELATERIKADPSASGDLKLPEIDSKKPFGSAK